MQARRQKISLGLFGLTPTENCDKQGGNGQAKGCATQLENLCRYCVSLIGDLVSNRDDQIIRLVAGWQYLIAICSRPEAASNVISGRAVD